jgi:protein-S-isoprenylcysteine O-methyltransferase Ste14
MTPVETKLAGQPAPGHPDGSLGAFQRLRRAVLAVLLAACLAVLLVGQSMVPPGTVFHETVEMAGVLAIFLGIVGRLWSTLYIGGRKAAVLVTGGPYSITRNPLYLFSTLAAAGVGAQMGSVLAAALFATLCAAAFHVVILREERFLRQALGPDYAAYCARVPRFWPRLDLYEEGDTGRFEPSRLRQTLLDGLVFLVAMPVFELIDEAQASGLLPVLFRLP